MAQRTVIDCDKCKKPNSVLESGRLQVAVHRGLDAAGSNDTHYEQIDLCPNCQSRELERFLGCLNYEEGKKWVTRVRATHS